MATSTSFYVSGPCYTWVGSTPAISFGGSWNFLGFSESGITVALTQQTEDVAVDYAGTMPGTVSMLGEDIRSSGTFTRYNEQVMQQIVSFKGPQGLAGFGQNNILGSLMYEEGLSFPVLLFSPYSFKDQYGNMVPGWNIPNGIYDDTNRRTLSVRRTAPECAFRGLPVFGSQTNPSNPASFVAGLAPFNAYELYTNIMPNPLPSVD